MTLKMGPSDMIRQFANKIYSIEHELSYSGHTLSNDDKKLALLSGVTSEFDVKRTILQENIRSTSFESMVSGLDFTEDESKNSGKAKGSSTGSSTAFVASDKNNGKKQGCCFTCKKPNHIMNKCFHNHKSKSFKKNLKPSEEIESNL